MLIRRFFTTMCALHKYNHAFGESYLIAAVERDRKDSVRTLLDELMKLAGLCNHKNPFEWEQEENNIFYICRIGITAIL